MYRSAASTLPARSTVTAGLITLIFGLVRTETYPWASSEVLIPLALAAVLLTGFVWLQARVSKAPLVPLRLFRSRSVTGANITVFMLFGALVTSGYFESLYLQRVLGFSPLVAGFAFLPQAVFMAGAAQVTARLVSRFGPRPLIAIGTVLSGLGLFWLSQITPTSTYFADVFGPFVLVGVGMGLAMTPVTVAGTAGMVPHEAGLVSGVLNTSRTVGSSIGLAALTTIAAKRSAGLLGGATASAAHTAAALTDGYAFALAVSGGVLMVTAAVAITIPARARPQVAAPAPDSAPAPAPAPDSNLALEEA